MTVTDLQTWLTAHGHPTAADGHFGPASAAALLAAFTNPAAPVATPADIAAVAARLGCSVAQIRAVAAVESSGSGFNSNGRPKMLFERHMFHRATAGRWSPASFSNPVGGGYADSSWDKLIAAAAHDPGAAFASASWGKFQVLGLNWQGLGYDSAIDLAWATVTGEAAQYELFARFLERNNLLPAMRAISRDPATNVAFASHYNGPRYAKFRYDHQLAEHMA